MCIRDSAKSQRVAWAAEYLRGVTAELADAEHKSAHHRAELDKAENKNRLTRLTAPVAGTVQQLAVHTEGGVVTPAQVLDVYKRQGPGFPLPDGYIAAIAVSRGFIVASRDTAPFKAARVTVINPWET